MKLIAKKLTTTSTIIVLFFVFCVSLTKNGASCASTSEVEELLESLAETDHVTNNSSTISTTANGSSNSTMSAPAQEMIEQQNTTALNSNSATKRTCACDDSEESLICANNGITYKNACRFDCAKARVTRLRQVKQGRCSQASGAQSYWQSKKSG